MTPSPPGSGPGARGGAAGGATPTDIISRYQVIEKIGEGGMGSLYLARDPAIDRLVAIKVLRRGLDTPELRERFTREARAAGRLRHPNIVTIFDVGEHNGDPFIAMEFLAGETLGELIGHGARLSLVRRLKLIEELADGLAYAHRAGIVHRDIKPANLMVDSEGILKILDFGIVRLDESGATQSGVLVGTVNYMSPEQVMGSDIDLRSDIFAVGLVAYELLSGRQAFPGTLKDGLFNRILNVAIEPLRARLPDLDPAIAAIVEQALQREPVDRYQDLAKMRNDLVRVRQRLEAAEERAVEGLGGDSGETIIATAPAPTPAMGSGSRGFPGIEAAERALADGDYRTALTLAGRSAVLSPHDQTVSDVMARAQAGLLARARALPNRASPIRSPLEPPAGGALEAGGALRASGAPPAAGAPASGAPAPGSGSARSGSPAPDAAHSRVSAPVIALAAVVLLAALVGVLLLTRDRNPSPAPEGAAVTQVQRGDALPDPASSSPPEPAPDAPAEREQDADAGAPVAALPAASAPAAPVVRQAPPPGGSRGASPTGRASTAPESAESPPVPPGILRVGAGVAPPRRVHYVEPKYPPSALPARARGTVRLDLTVGRDGRVADAHVTSSMAPEFDRAALEAVRKWEFSPVIVGGRAVPVVYPVSVDFTPPEPVVPSRADAQPVLPSPPQAPIQVPSSPAQAPAQVPAPGPATARPSPDIRTETAVIHDVLKRYAAAWQSLDADAVARVHELSSGQLKEVRATMANAQEYGMDIEVRDVAVDQANGRATVQCSITRRFRPTRGNSQTVTVASVITLEKRGSGWKVTGIR